MEKTGSEEHYDIGHQRAQEKPPPVDLDGCVEDVDEVMTIQAQKESNEFQRLQRKLTYCNPCGPDKWCKVNKVSTHVHLTALQLGGWVL